MSRPSCRADVLAAMPGTRAEIHAKCSVECSCIVRMIRILRDAGQCHVTAWKRTVGKGGPIMPIYAAGPGEDAKPLKRLPLRVYSRRYRKTHPEAIALANDARRARYWADRARKTPQSWLSALGVGAA